MEQENEKQLAEFQLIMKSYEEQPMGLGEQELEACTQYREKELQIKEEYKTYEENETEEQETEWNEIEEELGEILFFFWKRVFLPQVDPIRFFMGRILS